MSIQKTCALYGVLAERYDVGFSQGIADQVEYLDKRDIQFIDIKELNDLQAEYRTRIRNLVRSYRVIKEKGASASSLRQLYTGHESIFIRQEIESLWKVYRIITADAHEMTAAYLEQLSFRNYRASHHTEKECRAVA